MNRGFLAAVVLMGLQSRGIDRNYLIRLRNDSKVRVVKRLGPGDELVELQLSRMVQSKHPDLPKTVVARRLMYQRKGYRPQGLLTSLLEPSKYPAKKVVAFYHERWEFKETLHLIDRCAEQIPDSEMRDRYRKHVVENVRAQELSRSLHAPND